MITENDKDKVVEEITNYHKLDLYTNKDLHDIADKTPREDEINDYLHKKIMKKMIEISIFKKRATARDKRLNFHFSNILRYWQSQ